MKTPFPQSFFCLSSQERLHAVGRPVQRRMQVAFSPHVIEHVPSASQRTSQLASPPHFTVHESTCSLHAYVSRPSSFASALHSPSTSHDVSQVALPLHVQAAGDVHAPPLVPPPSLPFDASLDASAGAFWNSESKSSVHAPAESTHAHDSASDETSRLRADIPSRVARAQASDSRAKARRIGVVKCARRLVAAAILAISALDASGAQAEEPHDAATVESARTLFNEGNAHFHAGRWAAALAAFQKSRALVDSPNTTLMIARCLRELGHAPAAVETFQQAASEANARVAQGEAKYAPTEKAAADEGRRLRSMLGSVRIRVTHRDGATVTVDGKPVPLDASGEATVLHEPGSATVVVRDAAGAEQRQVVTVLAGSALETEFAGAAPPRATTAGPALATAPAPAPPPAAADRTTGPTWVVPAALASGVLTLAGTGVFIGFGSSSHAKFTALEAQCGPSSCGPEQRAEADAGERQQTIANVGLGVAAVAAAATIAFVVVALASPGR